MTTMSKYPKIWINMTYSDGKLAYVYNVRLINYESTVRKVK